jgi:hypothetical protein
METFLLFVFGEVRAGKAHARIGHILLQMIIILNKIVAGRYRCLSCVRQFNSNRQPIHARWHR